MLGKKNSCVGICGGMAHESALRRFWLLSSPSTLLLLPWHGAAVSAQSPAEVLSGRQASLLFWCSASSVEQQKNKNN